MLDTKSPHFLQTKSPTADDVSLKHHSQQQQDLQGKRWSGETQPLLTLKKTSYNKTQLDALISEVYFWIETPHVLDSFSDHHQEFFTVHTATVNVIQVC
jgi:hypothetical protein